MKKYKKRMKNKIVKKPNKLEEKIKINPHLLRAKVIFRRLIMILVGGGGCGTKALESRSCRHTEEEHIKRKLLSRPLRFESLV